MSTVAIPPTKTSAGRPPVLPPISTTFDGAPDGGDSWLEWLQDDVRLMCRHADAASPDGLEMMIEILERRNRLVLSEIWAYEATDGSSTPLPPIGGFPLDYLIETPTREQRILQDLLNRLEDCKARCERRSSRHRFEVRLKRDLGASDL